MSASREQILDWADSGHLSADKVEQALSLATSLPSDSAKLNFLSRVVLAFAVLLLCSGVIFFFAYNWDDLSRYGKFAIAQGALILSLLPLLRVNLQQPVGQAALFAASLLVGALLALLGQTYQSGADTYQLFLLWAVLIAPWVLLARIPALWLLLLALLNLSLLLALDDLAIHHLFVPFTNPGWAVLVLNLSTAGIWIVTTQRLLSTPLLLWAERSICLYCLLIMTVLALDCVFSWSDSDAVTLPIWAVFSAGWLYLYRLRRLDLVMLSALAMAAIILLVSILAKTLWGIIPFEGLYLLLALTVMGLSSVVAIGLRRLTQAASLAQASTAQGFGHD